MAQSNFNKFTKDEQLLNAYNKLAVKKILSNYSQNEEIKLTNEGIADATNAAYVAYRVCVATCKAEAHNEVYGS